MYEIERHSGCWLLAANALASLRSPFKVSSKLGPKCRVELWIAFLSWLLKSLKTDNLLTDFGTLYWSKKTSPVKKLVGNKMHV